MALVRRWRTMAQGGGDDNAPMPLACVAAGTHHSLVATNAEGLVYSFGAVPHGSSATASDRMSTRHVGLTHSWGLVSCSWRAANILPMDDMGVCIHGARARRGESSTWRWLARPSHHRRAEAAASVCGLCHVRVVSIAAGSRHSLVLADGGAVYSFGDGDGGQLGVGSDELGAGRMLCADPDTSAR